MKRIRISSIVFFVLCYHSIFSQQITKIDYKQFSSFDIFPKKYTIDILSKKLIVINPIDASNNREYHIRKKRMIELQAILNRCNWEQIPDTTASGGDGTNYYLTIYYDNKKSKSYRAWSLYKSEEYILLYNFIKKHIRN